MKIKIDLSTFRVIRAKYDLSQQDMADILGIARFTYYRKESGMYQFKLSELLKIANYFNLSIKQFMQFFKMVEN